MSKCILCNLPRQPKGIWTGRGKGGRTNSKRGRGEGIGKRMANGRRKTKSKAGPRAKQGQGQSRTSACSIYPFSAHSSSIGVSAYMPTSDVPPWFITCAKHPLFFTTFKLRSSCSQASRLSEHSPCLCLYQFCAYMQLIHGDTHAGYRMLPCAFSNGENDTLTNCHTCQLEDMVMM